MLPISVKIYPFGIFTRVTSGSSLVGHETIVPIGTKDCYKIFWTYSPSMQKWASFCIYFWATKQNMKRRMPLEVWQVPYSGNRRPSIFYMCCILRPLWLLHNEYNSDRLCSIMGSCMSASAAEWEMLEMGLIYFIVGDVAGCCSPLLTLVCWIIGS